jgi:TRAP-type C4-dicarboxylate transport system permease small subunit
MIVRNVRLSQLANLGVWLAGLSTIVMMVHITADVALKFFFNWPIPATLEIVSAYYMVACVFLPIAAVELTHSSIAVDTVYQFLPRSGKFACMVVVFAGSAAVYLLLAWISWGDALRSFAVGEVMFGNVPVSVWPSRFLMPVSLLLAGVVCLWHLGRLLGSPQDRELLMAEHGPVIDEQQNEGAR